MTIPISSAPAKATVQAQSVMSREEHVGEAAKRAMHDLKNMLTSGEYLLKLKEQYSISGELSTKITQISPRVNEITALIFKFEQMGEDRDDKKSSEGLLDEISKKHKELLLEVTRILTDLRFEVSKQGVDLADLDKTIKTIESNLQETQFFVDNLAAGKLSYAAGENVRSTKVPLESIIKAASLAFEKGKNTITQLLQRKHDALLSSVKASSDTEKTGEEATKKIVKEATEIEESIRIISNKRLLPPKIDSKNLSRQFISPRRKLNAISQPLGTEIARIISNTLSNAAKHGGENTQFSALWVPGAESEESGYLNMIFKDDGEGVQLAPNQVKDKSPHDIDELAKKKLFPPYRAQASTTGSGFGGNNISYVVDELGGSIKVRTKGGSLDKGSEITFKIPLVAVQTEAKITAPPVSKPLPIPEELKCENWPKANLRLLQNSRIQVVLLEDNMVNEKITLDHIRRAFGLSIYSQGQVLKEAEAGKPPERVDIPPPICFASGSLAMERGEEKLVKITEVIQKAVNENRPVVAILNNFAGAGPTGHEIAAHIRKWLTEQISKHPEKQEAYDKVKIFAHTGDSFIFESHLAHYSGFLAKPLHSEAIPKCLYQAIIA